MISGLGNYDNLTTFAGRQADGAVVVVSGSNTVHAERGMMLLQLTDTGRRDRTIGPRGLVRPEVPDWPVAALLQPDGKLLVLIRTSVGSGSFQVRRYLP